VGRAGASGGLPLSTLKQTPARTIAERAAERFRARHPERTLEVSLDDRAPPIIVDQMLLRRVIDNILENAHKYTPDTADTITLRLTAHEGAALFEVEDNGIGIAPNDLAHVFDPFFRVERSRTRGAGGVGLGLTLAKRIVEAHGGTIDVSSALGDGTTVSVLVPGR